MKKFEVGDRVIIHMAYNTAFGFITRRATIEYVPVAPGDSWYFTLDNPFEKNGKMMSKSIMVNQSCSDFAGLSAIEGGEN